MLENCSTIFECEKELISKTCEHKLIGETIITHEDVKLVGSLIKEHLDCDGFIFLKHNASACVSYFLVWKGVFEYVSSEGNYWSAVEYSLGQMDPNIKANLGQIFFRFLRNKNLPLFELPHVNKYVTNILIHGMIPDSNLEEYFEKVIIYQRKHLPNVDIEGIVFFIESQRECEKRIVSLEHKIEISTDEIENFKEKLSYNQAVLKLWHLLEQSNRDYFESNLKDIELQKNNKNEICPFHEKITLDELKYQPGFDSNRILSEEISMLKIQGISRKDYIELTNKLKTEIQDEEKKLENIYSKYKSIPKPFPYINEPIRKFLLYGNKPADKFLFESFKMLEFAQENKILDYRDNIDLQERIVDKFIIWWDSYENPSENNDTESFIINKKGQFYQPIIKFDYKENIIAILPVQKISLTGNIKGLVLTVNSDNGDYQKFNIPGYNRDSYIETEQMEFRLISPSKNYVFKLLNGNELLYTWFFEYKNLYSEYKIFVFDYESKKLINKEQLPKERLLVVAEKKYIFNPDYSVFENGELYGKWRDFIYWAVDLRSGITSLWLEDDEGRRKYLPLSEKRSLKPVLVGGKILEKCNPTGQIVYLEKPPSISIGIENIDDIDNWNIYINYKGESTLVKPLYSKLNAFLNILQYDEDLTYILPLSNDLLLGERPVGNFNIRLKNYSENIDQEFNFFVIPLLTFEFDKEIYLPNRNETSTVYAELNCTAGMTFEPENTVDSIYNDNCYQLETDISKNSIKGLLKYLLTLTDFIEIPVELQIPRLTWRIEGLRKDKFHSDFYDVIEIPEEILDDRLGNELLLTATMPPQVIGKCRLELSGTNQFDEVIIKNGIARFDILKFLTTIKSNKNSLLSFELTTYGQGIQIEKTHLFSIQKWKVKNIRHEVSKNENNCLIKISWEEEGDVNNKNIALWKLTEGSGKLVVEKNIEKNRNSQLQVSQDKIEIGRYLIHLTKKDDWKPLTFPGENSPNTKEILIGINEDDAPLITANERFDRGEYLKGILILKQSYKDNDLLKNTWLHKINHVLIRNYKLKEAIDIFRYLLLEDKKFSDTDSFPILIRLLTICNQKSESLDENDTIHLLEIIIHILVENCKNKLNYRESSMVIRDKKINSNIFKPLKLIYQEQGDELESILKNPCNESLCLKLERAKEVLNSIKGMQHVT